MPNQRRSTEHSSQAFFVLVDPRPYVANNLRRRALGLPREVGLDLSVIGDVNAQVDARSLWDVADRNLPPRFAAAQLRELEQRDGDIGSSADIVDPAVPALGRRHL